MRSLKKNKPRLGMRSRRGFLSRIIEFTLNQTITAAQCFLKIDTEHWKEYLCLKTYRQITAPIIHTVGSHPGNS
jgi:hypothetical protein